jgi:hypothetical protein
MRGVRHHSERMPTGTKMKQDEFAECEGLSVFDVVRELAAMVVTFLVLMIVALAPFVLLVLIVRGMIH